ncbi:hypothetical protein COCMIDRAFT_33630 [Bipolaris oryzae ATCC 44560]|uniref:Heterokaryon incompatibility domain-containing protein n=1 Tax=Bipolaris oryzae ATCC 44560 TaxID=930090 RepID=W6ZZ01_COCMI|nr:uncharacterized protein COCMIDRAFT_33630 [Bipolaris oryzae ATCC 44560]EUC48956.1 hypothetical protein COCMIDRAFT_33630 [Bipolaris oryzae ATCC 44560]
MEPWELLCDEPQPVNDSEHLTEFAYEPLISPQGCIRLIDILELSTDGTIICSMKEKQFYLNESSYNALSYCWGPSKPLYPIIINNKVLHIRGNLRDFMYYARTAHEDACHDIWIDAICINQLGLAERNIQVSQMHHIFSNASAVYAWIGNWDTTFSPAFQRLEYPDVEIPETRNNNSIVNISMELLFARDYWSQMWIVQENILASNIRLLCGSKSIPWNTLSVVIARSQDSHHRALGGLS